MNETGDPFATGVSQNQAQFAMGSTGSTASVKGTSSSPFPPISARLLASLALKNTCERCFWIRAKYGDPSIPFPGIVSTLDSIAKQVLGVYKNTYGRIPPWYLNVPPNAQIMPSVHWKSFQDTIQTSNGSLTIYGIPDDILQTSDGLIIIDYKTTAKPPATSQSPYQPAYEAQLNAYAYIAQNISGNAYSWLPQSVHQLALLYYTPVVRVTRDHLRNPAGFITEFNPQWIPVSLNLSQLHTLASRAIAILSQPTPPPPSPTCDLCKYYRQICPFLCASSPSAPSTPSSAPSTSQP